MSLCRRLSEYISACFTGLWVQSHEHEDAMTEMAQMCRENDWRLAVWDIHRGLSIQRQNDASVDTGTNDPLAAIRSLDALGSTDGASLLLLVNFHRFLQSPEVIQALAVQINKGKQNRTFIVILSPVVSIPVELEKLFVVVEHDLPCRDQLHEIARGIATEQDELPAGAQLDLLLDAAAGFVLGSFTESDDPLPVLQDHLGQLRKPVLGGWPAGHGTPNRALPMGALATLDADAGSLRFDQPVLV